VGINTLGLSGGGDNIGFAIPSNVAREVAERLKEKGEVARAWTGLHLQPLNDFYSNTFIDEERGVLVSDVDKNSPAHEAGIKSGDIMISVNDVQTDGKYAESLPDLRWLLADLPIDKPAIFEIKRGEEIQKIEVSLVAKGKVEGEDFDCDRWDMTVKGINKFKNPDLYFYQKEGVFIQGIKYPGNAGDAGLYSNDIIVSVDRKPIKSLDDIKKVYDEIVKDEEREKRVMFEILRSGYKRWIVLDYRKDYDEEE
jgi:serine protease Do